MDFSVAARQQPFRRNDSPCGLRPPQVFCTSHCERIWVDWAGNSRGSGAASTGGSAAADDEETAALQLRIMAFTDDFVPDGVAYIVSVRLVQTVFIPGHREALNVPTVAGLGPYGSFC